MAVLVHWGFIFSTLIGWFFCWLIWVFVNLFLSLLCDIKLIRNKLYGENNKNLKIFLIDETGVIQGDELINLELMHLEQLLIRGAISAEEYENRKMEYESCRANFKNSEK